MTDENEDIKDADDAAIEAVRKKAEQAEEVRDSPVAEGLPSEAEMLDKPPKFPVETDDEIKETRRERRANRYREAQEARERAEQEAAQLRQQLMQERAIQQQRQAPPPKTEDPYEAEFSSILRERSLLQQELIARQKDLTPEQIDDYERKAHALELKQQRLAAKQVMDQQGIRPHDPQAAERAALQARHQDVFQHPQALRYARGRMEIELATLGRQASPHEMHQMFEEIADESREKFGMRTHRPKPTRASQSRYAGVPRGRTAPSEPKTKTITMTKDFRRMADEVYPHIKNPTERYKKWAQGPGRRHLEKQQG